MGWNEYGGWRIGIRDNHNTYHYFAHLAYFDKGIKEGDIVEPGTLLGFVGSTGYGKEGTSGKFPPHLHYGLYKYNGKTEWAFDPYPRPSQLGTAKIEEAVSRRRDSLPFLDGNTQCFEKERIDICLFFNDFDSRFSETMSCIFFHTKQNRMIPCICRL